MSNTRYPKFLAIGLLVLLSLGLLSACSSGADNGIGVTLTSYDIQMERTTASPGDITFNVKNEATDMAHEFVIFKTDLDAANLPTDDSGNVIEDDLELVDEIELDPSESGDLTVNLDAGHYVVVCNQPGHYSQDMFTNFTVQ